MNASTKSGASTVAAQIAVTEPGGFLAVASNGDLDRDGERILPGCFAPLPESIPIHLDHTMSAASVVARGRPYYDGDLLMVDATFAGTEDAQRVRAKVKDRTLDSLSIVFMGSRWEDVEGTRTCVQGELLAADIVSVPSNRTARILSMRGAKPSSALRTQVDAVVADAVLAMAKVEIASADRLLRSTNKKSARRQVDAFLLHALGQDL